MSQVIQAQNLNVIDVETKFGLTQTNSDRFFAEWFEELPELTDLEKQVLDRTKTNYLNLIRRRKISENMVKITVLDPLLAWTDFYQRPFDILDEREVELAVADRDEIVRGRLDILVLKNQMWLLVIESKNAGLSLLNGIRQALFYMANSPSSNHPIFGLVTNGDDFLFIKLTMQNSPQYAFSEKFTLLNPRDNELYTVLKILKKLSQLLS